VIPRDHTGDSSPSLEAGFAHHLNETLRPPTNQSLIRVSSPTRMSQRLRPRLMRTYGLRV